MAKKAKPTPRKTANPDREFQDALLVQFGRIAHALEQIADHLATPKEAPPENAEGTSHTGL